MTNKQRLMGQIKDLINQETHKQTTQREVVAAIDEHVGDYHRGHTNLKQLVALMQGELRVAEDFAIRAVRQRLDLH